MNTEKKERRWWQSKEYPKMWATWFVFVLIFGGIALLVGIGVPTVKAISNNNDRTNCRKFGESSGYPTEFAYYGFWKNECFAVMPDGLKIPIDQMYNNQGN